MYRVDHTSAADQMPTPGPVVSPGYFTEGNVLSGIDATILTADFLNGIQEELMYLLAKASLSASKTDFTQIFSAINLICRPNGANSSPSAEPANRTNVTLDATDISHIAVSFASGNPVTIKTITGGTRGKMVMLTNGNADLTVYVNNRGGNIWLARTKDAYAEGTFSQRLYDGCALLLVFDSRSNIWREVTNSTNFGTLSAQVVAAGTNCATGNGQYFWPVPSHMDGALLTEFRVSVVTPGTVSGAMTVMIGKRSSTGTAYDMLTSVLSLPVGDYVAATSAFHVDYNRVRAGDTIYIDVDSVHGTPAKGLSAALSYIL